MQCDELLTGTIKRAPCDFLSQCRRQSSHYDRYSSSGGTGSPTVQSIGDAADSDSDEEQFPPPPPMATTPVPSIEIGWNKQIVCGLIAAKF